MTPGLALFFGLIVFLFVMAAAFFIHVWMQPGKLRTLLPTLRCPSCGAAYGAGALSTMTKNRAAMPDAYAADVIEVTCPHCSIATQYRSDGQLHEIHASKK